MVNESNPQVQKKLSAIPTGQPDQNFCSATEQSCTRWNNLHNFYLHKAGEFNQTTNLAAIIRYSCKPTLSNFILGNTTSLPLEKGSVQGQRTANEQAIEVQVNPRRNRETY
uniref:Uncharacterized protein n=1 Tax=Opuntia streptacantha TaxID=393608 RepID=A0A7C9E2A8_OPUST